MNTSESENQHKITPWDLLFLMLESRKFIIINFIIVTVLSVVLSLILPVWFKATTSILPPKDQGGLNLFGISNAAVRSLSLGQRLGGIGSQNLGAYNYLAILKSRSAMESVVKQFNLIDVYSIGENSMDRAIKELEQRVSIDLQEDNYITVQVIDKSPQRAANMANYFVEVLNSISIRLGTQEARTNREFIEKRLGLIRDDLKTAEDALRNFQEKSGVIISPDQNSSSLNAIAELYAMKAKKEIEISILEKSITPDNESMRQLKLELFEIDKRLSTIPQTGLESIRLYRDVLVQQKIVEYLVPIYEQTKIDEQKDVPVILVLDKAAPPEKKFKPKRLIIVATAATLSLFMSFIIILFRQYFNHLKSIQSLKYEKVRDLVQQIRANIKLSRRN
jgi:tyrosine-protein kinase Etk/Wzc